MRKNFRPGPQNTGCSQPWRRVANVVVATIVVVASGTTKANGQQYTVVACVDAKSTGLLSSEVVVRIGNISVPATAIKASPEIPRNIAIVLDAGPDQAKVLSKEKDLAVGLINDLAGEGTSFTIAEAGTSTKMQAPTQDRSIAIEHVRGITGDSGKKTNLPIYDAIGSVIRKTSLTPGLRVVVFIGEGNDGGSRLRYTDLRNLAESNQIAFCAALVADHTLRGTKSILRYGWNLRELAGDNAGIFLENLKTPKAKRRIIDSIQELRLIFFERPPLPPGPYKISVSAKQGRRLHAQRAVVIP